MLLSYIKKIQNMCIPEGIITQIEEGKTIQWSKEKGQKDKQLSTKHHTKQDLAT
jgi:hypothetical protein